MAALKDATADEAKAALREASGLVAQAITRLASLGADAPSNVREAMNCLGMAFNSLGWADPGTPYSVHGMEEMGEGEMEME